MNLNLLMKKLILTFKLCLGAKFGDGKQFFPFIDIKDVNDNVTITPNTVYKDVYGAVIGTLSADWNFFSQLTISLCK